MHRLPQNQESPFHFLATVVSKSRQATVIVTGFWYRSTEIPLLSDESGNLHRRFPEKASDAQLLTTSTAFSGTLRVPF